MSDIHKAVKEKWAAVQSQTCPHQSYRIETAGGFQRAKDIWSEELAVAMAAAPAMLKALLRLDEELSAHFWQPSADGTVTEPGTPEAIYEDDEPLAEAWAEALAAIAKAREVT